jgi:hypothetical protein
MAELLLGEKSWTVKELGDYFKKDIYDGLPYINRGIMTAQFIGFIQVDNGGKVRLSRQNSESEKTEFIVARLLIERLHKDDKFVEVFPESSLGIDYLSGSVILKREHLPLKYAPVWNLFDNLFSNNRKTSIEIPEINFRKLFRYSEVERRVISKEQFLKSLKDKETSGLLAEEYVEKYEKNRLFSHERSSSIMRISDIDISAGYDIVSFNKLTSKRIDRFIEVKSFSGTKPTFHWSENEIATATRMGSDYYLYLVDRSKIADYNYKPIIIRNPHENILYSNEWVKEPKSFFCYQVID